MLEDIASHLLDIAQNGVAAGASCIEVLLQRDQHSKLIIIQVQDNGKGMSEEFLVSVLDPFFTERTVRRVGMGLPFLKQQTELCNGDFKITSKPGAGTCVFASFAEDHINTPPIGDVGGVFVTLLIDAPNIHWVFRYTSGERFFVLDSVDIEKELGGMDYLKYPDVALGLKGLIEEGIAEIDGFVR